MPLRKFKRAGTWYIRGAVNGERVYQSAHTADETQAEEARARLEARLWDRRVGGLRGTTTFSEALIAYIGARDPQGTWADALDRLNNWFGPWQLGQIDQAAVERYIAAKMPKAKAGTRIHEAFGPVSAVLRFAAKRGWCDAPTFDRPTPPPGVVRWITYPEADRLLEECAEHMRPIVTFLLFTGARLGEAMALQWREVDLANRRVAFLDTKNGTSRGAPLHSRVVAALANLTRREGPVFRRPDGHAYEGTGSPIRTGFKAACRRAGIKGFRVHDCRHTFASWYVMAGGDLRSLAELLGHKSLQLVMRYSHLAPDHLRAGVDRLGANSVQPEITAPVSRETKRA